MAWLQNLAGRAEDLLNKIDQNAATVLNETTRSESGLMSEDSSGDIDVQINIETADEEKSIDDYVADSVSDDSNVPLDLFNEKSREESPFSKSNSFILAEDIQAYNDKINELELETRDLNKQLLNLQHLYAELRNENAGLLTQVEASNLLVANAQSEMEQYKARAQRILQEKEDLISLKSSKSPPSDDMLSNYNDELKKELEFQKNKNVENSEKNSKLTNEVAYFQQQIVLLQNSTQQSIQILEENLDTELKTRAVIEEEFRSKNAELQAKSQELVQSGKVIAAKSQEIDQLHEALRRKVDNPGRDDLEIRIKSLTDTLLLKQSTVEQVTTERNALRIQLEKIENEYHANLAQLERAQIRVVNMNDTDDVKSQVPHFLKMSPSDAGVTRRVKHAYSTLDAVSIRTGIFLRRYPLARVFVFCYMILLHFWALMLLFVYAPSSR